MIDFDFERLRSMGLTPALASRATACASSLNRCTSRGRAHEPAGRPVHHDRHVPGLRLDGVALGARGVGGDALERVDPGRGRLLEPAVI